MTGGALAGGDLPARSRGVIALLEENCTACMLCARECPDWCIYIESHKEPVPGHEYGAGVTGPAPGDEFGADVTGAVPGAEFGAGRSGPAPGPAAPGSGDDGPRSGADPVRGPAGRGRQRVRNVLDLFAIDIAALTHEQGRLREWMWTVPPPPAHDAGAPRPREGLADRPRA